MKAKYSYAILTMSLSLNLIAQTNNSFNGSRKTYNQPAKPSGIMTQSEVENLLIKMGYADKKNAEVRAQAILEQISFQSFSQHHLSEKSGPNWKPEHVVRYYAEEKLGYVRNSHFEATVALSHDERVQVERSIKAFAYRDGLSDKDILSHPNFESHLQEAILNYRTGDNIKRGIKDTIYPEDRTLMNPITLEAEQVGRASRVELIARSVVMSVANDMDKELKDRNLRLSRLQSKTEFEKLTPAQQDSVYQEAYNIRESYLRKGKRELSQLRSLALELSALDEKSALKLFGFATYENMNLDDFVKELHKHQQEKISFFRYTQLQEALIYKVIDFKFLNAYSEEGRTNRHNAFLSLYSKLQFVNSNLNVDIEVLQGTKALTTDVKRKVSEIKNKEASLLNAIQLKETAKSSLKSAPTKCSALFAK